MAQKGIVGLLDDNSEGLNDSSSGHGSWEYWHREHWDEWSKSEDALTSVCRLTYGAGAWLALAGAILDGVLRRIRGSRARGGGGWHARRHVNNGLQWVEGAHPA